MSGQDRGDRTAKYSFESDPIPWLRVKTPKKYILDVKVFVPQTAGKPRARPEASTQFLDQEMKQPRSPGVTILKEQCEAKEKALVRTNSLEHN